MIIQRKERKNNKRTSSLIIYLVILLSLCVSRASACGRGSSSNETSKSKVKLISCEAVDMLFGKKATEEVNLLGPFCAKQNPKRNINCINR